MQKSSVGFVYQINDLILVILRSSQKRAFPERLALNQSLPKSEKKAKQKKSHTWTTKFEECCWIRLFSMLFSNYSSKELKKFKKLWKFCFFVLQLHSGEQFKQKIAIRFTRSRDYRGAFYTSVFVVCTIMISPSTMVALVYV